VGERLAARLRPTLQPVINATGVIVHTNLGRAPLSDEARTAMDAVAAGYSNLEYDLEAGRRGSRYVHAEEILCQLTGAEAALVVNNNAAAVLLILMAFAQEQEVIISRGQLVEIGGGFRIPDVMRQSGATLVEVGTTNRTYIRDYAAAITERTAALMRVHRSNFRLVGFTHEPMLAEMVALAGERNLLMLDDLGSGTLLDTEVYGLAHEPTMQESVAAGASLVSCSGDKLLGGPQAGIILGRADLIAHLKRFPLTRALRVDKTTLASLQATLRHYLLGEATDKVPVWRMISQTEEALAERAGRWVEALQRMGVSAKAVPGRSTVGGGSLPGEMLDTTLVALMVDSPDTVGAQLRAGEPSVIARIEDDQLVLDPRTVLLEQEPELWQRVREAVL
jgi:L-seryl-tRNA(Ser) seleniumtransferase